MLAQPDIPEQISFLFEKLTVGYGASAPEQP